MTSKQAPTALKIVAWLFILVGICAVLEILVSLSGPRISLNFNALAIFVGHGLLRFSRGWRICALVVLWLELIFVPLIALFAIGRGLPGTIKFFGKPIGYASPGTVLLVAGVIFALCLWQYRVLTRRDVVELFYENSP